MKISGLRYKFLLTMMTIKVPRTKQFVNSCHLYPGLFQVYIYFKLDCQLAENIVEGFATSISELYAALINTQEEMFLLK